jgi:hypothetical protein
VQLARAIRNEPVRLIEKSWNLGEFVGEAGRASRRVLVNVDAGFAEFRGTNDPFVPCSDRNEEFCPLTITGNPNMCPKEIILVMERLLPTGVLY